MTKNKILSDFVKNLDSAASGSFLFATSDSDRSQARPLLTSDVANVVALYDSASTLALIDSSFLATKLGFDSAGSPESFIDSDANAVVSAMNTNVILDSSGTLGTPTKKWKNIYTKKLSFGGVYIDENGIDGGNATLTTFTLPGDYSFTQPTIPNLVPAAITPDPVTNSAYTTMLLKTDNTQSDAQVDGSTNGFTITQNGNATSTAFTPHHPKGYSTYFGGLNDYLSIGDDASLELGSSDFTFEMWIKTAATSQYTTLMSKSTGDFAAGMWSIQVNQSGLSSGNVAMYIGDHNVSSPVVATSGTSVIDNEWHHIAVVRNGSAFTIYIDGTSAGTGTSSATVSDIAGAIWIGDDGLYPNRDYLGYIRDARMVIGTAVYTSAFTPTTEPLTAIANTQLFTCHLPYISDGSSNAHSITTVGTVYTELYSPYDHVSYSPSSHGGSVYFDGTGDYLVTPSSTNVQLGTGDFTAECWFYCTSASSYHQIFSWRPNNGSSAGKGSFAINPSNGYIWYETSGIIDTSSNWLTNTWYHIALVKSSGTLKIYQNGVEVGSASHSTNLDGTTLSIAGNNDGSEGFAGYISDFRLVKGTAVYTSAFTPPTEPLTAIANTQLLTCTNKNNIWDASGNNLTIYGDATASTTETKYSLSSVDLDGTGDYISLDKTVGHFGSADFTIEGWWYFNTVSVGYQPLMSLGEGADSRGWVIITETDNELALYMSNGSAWSYNIISTTVPSLGWQHIAVVRSGSTLTFYLNGTSIGTASIGSNSTHTTTSGALYIGHYPFFPGGALSFNGYIEGVRITKGLARYTADFTPPTAELEG